jgi:hypothetical protein
MVFTRSSHLRQNRPAIGEVEIDPPDAAISWPASGGQSAGSCMTAGNGCEQFLIHSDATDSAGGVPPQDPFLVSLLAFASAPLSLDAQPLWARNAGDFIRLERSVLQHWRLFSVANHTAGALVKQAQMAEKRLSARRLSLRRRNKKFQDWMGIRLAGKETKPAL